MTKDYMLTVYSAANGPRDVQVNGATDMLAAIRLAERATGCRVDHGRSGIGSEFNPNIVIEAKSGKVSHVHDEPALGSMEVIQRAKISVPKG